MRRKRQELEALVVAAARDLCRDGWRSMSDTSLKWTLVRACEMLDGYELGEITDTQGRWNANAPETSRNAAVTVFRTGTLKRSIIDEIRIAAAKDRFGLSDDEIEVALKRSHTSVSSARNWLVNAGWLYDAGFRRPTRAGRPAVVWSLTPTAATRNSPPAQRTMSASLFD